MAKTTPSYLRLYNETRPQTLGRLGDFWPGLDRLCRAFEQATGWPLQCSPKTEERDAANPILWSAPASDEGTDDEQVRVAVATAHGHASAGARVDLNAAVDLAAGIGQLLGDLAQARHGLWKVEAELAAGVPLTPRTNEPHLAQRLQSSLKAAAEALGCEAAALYLVDETTTYLKLRSVWGLPQERFLLPPRELAREAADLEALLGHAIVLENTATQSLLRTPEGAAAAVCVPVSTSTAPLGTLWIFGDKPREFTDHEVNLVEVVAGRIAAELEREMLVAAGAEVNQLKRQLSAAERWQESQRPHISPLSDIWQVAGWTQAAGELCGEFYDWFIRGDESLVLALGACGHNSIAASLAASALRASVRAHMDQARDPAAAMAAINRLLIAGSTGDESASLTLILADEQSRSLQVVAAGESAVWKVGPAGASCLSPSSARIGVEPAERYSLDEVQMTSGEALIVLSECILQLCKVASETIQEQLISLMVAHADQPAAILVELVHDRLAVLSGQAALNDCTVVVLKCR